MLVTQCKFIGHRHLLGYEKDFEQNRKKIRKIHKKKNQAVVHMERKPKSSKSKKK